MLGTVLHLLLVRPLRSSPYSSTLHLQAITAAALSASPLLLLSLDLRMPFPCLDREPGLGSGVGTVPGGAGVYAWPCRPQQHEEQRLCERGSANIGSGGAHPELLSGCLQLLLLQVHSGEAVWGAPQEDLEPT